MNYEVVKNEFSVTTTRWLLPLANELCGKVMLSKGVFLFTWGRGRGELSTHWTGNSPPPPLKIHGMLWDRVNKQVVSILLKCFLVH